MAIEVLIVFAALALGGFVKGATGAGTPAVAVPVLASFFGVPFAIAVMVVPTIVTNALQIRQFFEFRHGLGYLRWLFVTGFVGAAAGTWLLTALPATFLNLALAIVIILYAAVRLTRPHWRIPPVVARRIAPTIGLLAGILQGTTGISAPISITFLTAIGLSRPQFILSVSTLFIAFVSVQVPALAIAGILTVERSLLSAAALLPVLVAMPLGSWFAGRIGPNGFDRLILTLLGAIAVKLIYDSGLFGSF
jgi:uncharacterized membrane protein YfcA